MKETVLLYIMIMCVCGYKKRYNNKRFRGEIPNDVFVKDSVIYHQGSLPEKKLSKDRLSRKSKIFTGETLLDKHSDGLNNFIGFQILKDPKDKGYKYGNDYYYGDDEMETMNKYERFYKPPRFQSRKGIKRGKSIKGIKGKSKGGFETLQTFDAPDNPLNKLNRNNRKGTKSVKGGIKPRIVTHPPRAWRPTQSPTKRPTDESESPTNVPTKTTILPSVSPTSNPSMAPFQVISPSISPIPSPSFGPSIAPTLLPTTSPLACNFPGKYIIDDATELYVCENNDEYFIGIVTNGYTSAIARGNQIISNSDGEILNLTQLTLRADLVPECWIFETQTLQCTFSPETFQYGSDIINKDSDIQNASFCFQSSNDFNSIIDPLFLQNQDTNIAHITNLNNDTGCVQSGAFTTDYIQIEQFFSNTVRIACSDETPPTLAALFTQITPNEIIGATQRATPGPVLIITGQNDIYTFEENTTRQCPIPP